MKGPQFVMLHAPNVSQVRDFYVEKLGFAVDDEAPGFLQFGNGGEGAALAIGEDPAGKEPEAVELWWFVDDADSAHASLVGAGVETLGAPVDEPFGRAFSLKDPAGNILHMLQLPQRG